LEHPRYHPSVQPYRPQTSPTPHANSCPDGWVPVGALLPETRARLTALGAAEPSGAAIRGGGSPIALNLVGACVIVLALLVTLTSPSIHAFGNPSRAALLLIAGAFAGMMLAAFRLGRSGRLAPPVLHIGPTTLIVVHGGHIRVFPAESLEISNDQIVRGNEIVDDGVHDADWIAKLLSARSTAQTSPAECERDPFRAAASSQLRIGVGALRGARMRPFVLAAIVGVFGAITLEAIPLGLLGRRAERIAREQREHDALERRRAAERELQRAQQDADVARERARQRRERALNGSEHDAREWLQHAGILDDPQLIEQVRARLTAICNERYPAREGASDERVLFVTMLRRACTDPEQSLYYMINGEYATEGARLISRHLREASEWLGVPMQVQPQPMQSPDGLHPYVEIRAIAIGESRMETLEEGALAGVTTRVQPMSMTVRLHDANGDELGIPAFTERVRLVESRTAF
jgi:hypothetical protein